MNTTHSQIQGAHDQERAFTVKRCGICGHFSQTAEGVRGRRIKAHPGIVRGLIDATHNGPGPLPTTEIPAGVF